MQARVGDHAPWCTLERVSIAAGIKEQGMRMIYGACKHEGEHAGVTGVHEPLAQENTQSSIRGVAWEAAHTGTHFQ